MSPSNFTRIEIDVNPWRWKASASQSTWRALMLARAVWTVRGALRRPRVRTTTINVTAVPSKPSLLDLMHSSAPQLQPRRERDAECDEH